MGRLPSRQALSADKIRGLLKNELARGFSNSIFLRFAGAGLSLLVGIVLARTLGAEGYGIYSYCLAIVTLLAIPAEFGIGTALVKFCAAYEKEKKWGLLNGLLKWTGRVVITTSLVFAAGATVFFLVFPVFLPETDPTALWWALTLIPVVSLGRLRAAALQGLRHFAKGQVPENIVRPGVVLVAIAVLYMTGNLSGLLASDTVKIYILASVVAFLLGARWLLQAVPEEARTVAPETDVRAWRNAVGIFALTNGGRVVLNRVDIVFVGVLVGAEAAGIYRAASALAGVLGLGLATVNIVIAPYFSRLYVGGQYERLSRLLWLSMGLTVSMALPVLLVLYFFGQDLINLIYGEAFSNAYLPLVILSLGHLVSAFAGPLASLLNMTGKEKWSLLSIYTSLAISVPLYILLLPRFGAPGAAAITAGAMVIMNVVLAFGSWRLIREFSAR